MSESRFQQAACRRFFIGKSDYPCKQVERSKTSMTRSACQLTSNQFVDIVRSMADSEFIHPGVTVRQNCLERFNLTVTEGALVLGVSRQALTNLLSGKAGISPEMALRLDKAFGGGAETWLQRQVLHDLAKARLRLDELNVVPMVNAQQPALF
jgi:addiction module HigA family antidote